MTSFTKTSLMFLAAAAVLSADTLRLKTGETFHGTYLGGTARQIRMEVAGDVKAFDTSQVDSVAFDASEAPASRAAAQAPAAARRETPVQASRPSNTSAPRGVTIPVGTEVTIRMIDAVNSETSRTGQTYQASLDEAVVVDGQEVIPRGADVLTKLVNDQQSGKIQGRAVLTMALSTISVNGTPRDVNSTDVQTASASRGARTAKVVGGTAALGAIIGAIAGGGKGAAIGAGSGAAVGAGAEVLTGGQKVKIPSETRLTFRLQAPLQL